MTLTDLDGDTLRAAEVWGMCEPLLQVAVEQGGDYCGVLLTVPQVEELKKALDEFLKVNIASSV